MAPIIGRITINGEIAHFSTRLSIDPKRWLTDQRGKSAGKTIGKSIVDRKIDETLEDLRSALKAKYTQMILAGFQVSAESLKEAIFKSATRKKEESPKEVKLETVM